MSRRRKDIGDWGEKLAVDFLVRQGFTVLNQNYYSPVGEIDIVARLGDDFYFVEVKTRAAGELATDLAITDSKKYKLQKTIKRYCYERNIGEVGIVLAGLLIIYDRQLKKVKFRLVLFH